MRAERALALSLAALLLAACRPAEPTAADTEAAVKANLSWYLAPAFQAAFGAAAPARLQVARPGGKTIMLYSPNLLTDLGGGRVALISTGLPKGGCQDCGGAVSVAYLNRSGDRFTPLSRWDDVGPFGATGDPPAVGVQPGLFAAPALEVDAVTRKAGCQTTAAALFELQPSGPSPRVRNIVLDRQDLDDPSPPASDAPARGVILPGIAGKSFVVRYREKPVEEAAYAPGPAGLWAPAKAGAEAPEC